MADIGAHLLLWAEIVPYIILPICSFKQGQATAGNTPWEIISGTKMLHWDTVVKQARVGSGPQPVNNPTRAFTGWAPMAGFLSARE
jgi:hypothetical protein